MSETLPEVPEILTPINQDVKLGVSYPGTNSHGNSPAMSLYFPEGEQQYDEDVFRYFIRILESHIKLNNEEVLDGSTDEG